MEPLTVVDSYRPDLPDFGAYLVWPEPGVNWIHPEDLSLAMEWLPSRRVFQRTHFDGTFYHLSYSGRVLRVKPTLWTRLPETDVLPGDQVEVLADFGRIDACVAMVVDVFCNDACNGHSYWLRRGQMTLPQAFTRDQFRALTLRYRLRSGYYMHQPARFLPPADLELLNVGDLE